MYTIGYRGRIETLAQALQSANVLGLQTERLYRNESGSYANFLPLPLGHSNGIPA
jgi:hypothetical protein